MLCKGLRWDKLVFCGGAFYAPQPAPQALLAMGFLARRGIKLPLPQKPTAGLSTTSSPRTASAEQYAEEGPPIPKNPLPPLAVQFEFRSFPRFPRTKKGPYRARNSKRGSGFWDLGFNSKPQPHRRVGTNGSPGGQSHRGPFYQWLS